MASLLGLRGPELEDIVRGALLHDIGKIGIPDAIVLKPSALTADEWALMRAHPLLGSELLEHIDFLSGARQLVLEHHERFDGAGYPHGIAGLDICIGAPCHGAGLAMRSSVDVAPNSTPRWSTSSARSRAANGKRRFKSATPKRGDSKSHRRSLPSGSPAVSPVVSKPRTARRSGTA